MTENTQTEERKIFDGYEAYNNNKPFHDFEEKPLVVGRIEGTVRIKGKFGENDCIIINDEYISLSNVALKGLDKFVGRFIRIEYLGKAVNEVSGNTYKKYDVQIKKEWTVKSHKPRYP